MQHSPLFARLPALALGVGAALASGNVAVSGFQLKENSVEAMGSAFSGAAVSETDTAVVANNPAAMTRFDGTTVRTDLTAIDLGFRFQGGGTDVTGQPLAGGDGGQAGDMAPVPASSLVHRLDNGLALGAWSARRSG